jgi:hypothetical protein
VKRAFAVIAGFIVSVSSCQAAPILELEKDVAVAEARYTFSDNDEAYSTNVGGTLNRQVNGYNAGYAVYYGLGNGTTGTLKLSNLRPQAYYDAAGGHYTTPNTDVAGLTLQKRVSNSTAIYAGYKYISGSWTYYKPSVETGTGEDQSRHVAELGLIGYKQLSGNISTYAKAGTGNGFTEYEVGIAMKSGQSTFSVGYNYQKIDDIYNSLYSTSGKMELTSQGMTVGYNYKF